MYADQEQQRRNKHATHRKGTSQQYRHEDSRGARAARHQRRDRIESVRQREMVEA